MSIKKNCPVCGKEFTNRWNKYCSWACAGTQSRKNVVFNKVCEECGAEFQSKGAYAKYCSADCKKEAAARRARQKKEEPKPIDPKWLRGPSFKTRSSIKMGSCLEGSHIDG